MNITDLFTHKYVTCVEKGYFGDTIVTMTDPATTTCYYHSSDSTTPLDEFLKETSTLIEREAKRSTGIAPDPDDDMPDTDILLLEILSELQDLNANFSRFYSDFTQLGTTAETFKAPR